MKVNAIVQARCGSTRFPGKVFAEIEGNPLLFHVVNRLRYANLIDDIVVATTINPKDDEIETWCTKERIHCFRGSEEDVLNRYYNASVSYPSEVVVRVTADDPFKEPKIIDEIIKKLIDEKLDLCTNNYPPSFPEGLDCEAFTFKTLKVMKENAKDAFEKEHVTQYIYHNRDIFEIGNVKFDRDISYLRWTIDTKEDLEMVRAIYQHRNKNNNGILLMHEILEIIGTHPDIPMINCNVERSAMYQ